MGAASVKRTLPPVLTPWRSPWAALALVLVLAGGYFGATAAIEYQWRANVIGVARSINPLPPDGNDPDFPIAILFSRLGEDYRYSLPVTGRFSEDPEVTKRRLARLMAALAAIEPEQRPRAVGVDMILSTTDPETDSYLAAAMKELGNVVLTATEDVDEEGQVVAAGPSPVLSDASARIGIDIHWLPAWLNPAYAVRLRVPSTVRYQHGELAQVPGFARAVAEVANTALDRVKSDHPDGVAIHYWNFHYPSTGDEEAGEPSDLLMDLWPAEAAAPIIALAPEWTPGEEPQAWLERVKATLAQETDPVWGTPRIDSLASQYGGRILLVGVGFPDDLASTPFTSRRYAAPGRQQGRSPLEPGVAVHGQAVATMLKGVVPREIPTALQLPAVVLAMVLGWVLGIRLRPAFALAALATLAVGTVVADLLLTAYANCWLPSATLLLPGGLAYCAGTIEQFRLLRESRSRVQKWVRRLMPPSSSAVISEDEADLLGNLQGAPGGESQTAWRTVIRTDLAGYTVMSRDLEKAGRPDMMMTLMSDFFLRAIGAVEGCGGQLTDLTGDGLVAVFGQEDPAEQSRRAVEAMHRLRVVAGEWRRHARQLCDQEKGLSAVRIPGIRMAVGASETSFRFVGTDQQQRTLFFGGAFILSARIEGAIKRLPPPPGVDALQRGCLDEAAARHLEDAANPAHFHVHEPIALQGIEKPCVVYELLQ
ncbi:CHASE2 domain-containing protein [bacterium]|nr:CHASE2 domain-containing protein [bacterium]